MVASRVSGVRLDQLLQQASEPAFWLNSELKPIWVNRAWERLTGHSAESVLGMVNAFGARGGENGALAGLGGSLYPPPEVLAGRPCGQKTLIVRAEGERVWRRVEWWPFHLESGGLTAILGLIRDVDEVGLASDSEAHRLRTELFEARDRLLDRYEIDSLLGQGAAHRRLLDQVQAAARTSLPALLVGEVGTGKRLAAKVIHQLGESRRLPIVQLDCSAVPVDVVERELFGRRGEEREEQSIARLALPDGATLVLGDILELPRDLQARLVPALDGRVRVVGTTSKDPDLAYRADRLRTDFYYKLTTIIIRLNPLRERLDELPLLAQHFLELDQAIAERAVRGFSGSAMHALLKYDWPGNLGELERVVREARRVAAGDMIQREDLPAAILGDFASAYHVAPKAKEAISLDEFLTQVERRLIESALQRSKHNKSRAAEMLGISRPRLYRRIKELNLPEEPEGAEVEALPLAPNASE